MTKFFFNPSKIIDRGRQCRDVYFKSIGEGERKGGTTEGPNETIHDQRVFCHRDPISISTSGVHVLAITRRGNGLKQFLRSKQIFYRYSKPVCTLEREFYFRVSLLERGGGMRIGEQKGRQEFSSRSLPPSLRFIVSTSRSENSFKMDLDLSLGGLD